MTSWFHAVCTPAVDEVDVDGLRVEGALPPGLAGDYLRNGANPRFPPLGSYLYPLDGDAMVHRIRIADGRATYRNRFVRTPALAAELSAGRALWPGVLADVQTPGPALVGPALAHTVKDRPNMSVVRHGSRLLALGESTDAFLLTPELETIGRETFGGLLTQGISPHPKLDPRTGELVLFCQLPEPPFLTWSVIDSNGRLRRVDTAVDGMAAPSLVHDVGLTEHFLVFLISPLHIGLDEQRPFELPVRWTPGADTRIALVPRDGGPTIWLRCAPFWAWHVVNAFETAGGEVVIDYPRWDAPGTPLDAHGVGVLYRTWIDPDTGRFREQALTATGLEMPRIDERLISYEHRTIGGVVRFGGQPVPPGAGNALAWYDTATGDLVNWGSGRLVVGEPCFAPDADSSDPARGWWLALATDPVDLRSRLLVLAGDDPAGGPVASIELPQHVPAGMHGSWVPKSDIRGE